jgi:osmotically-inducible protein OsmY
MAETAVEKQIKADVIAQLVWDDRVDARDIGVEVKEGGRIRLSGNVPSNRARRAAEQDAWVVNGVLWVENLITVQYPSEITLPSDAELAKNIKNMLLWDSSIDAAGIAVNVDGGHATLRGSVDAYWKKIDVEDIAQSVTGVLGATNHLVVVPTEDVVDETIARDIEGALTRNIRVNAEDVNVKVDNGKVTLTGAVPNGDAFRSAYDAALYTAGVTEVDNKLIIESY